MSRPREHAVMTEAAAPTDDALIAEIRAGNPARFGVLVRRYNPRLYRAARAILGDDAEAEDAVQDAYVRAFDRLAQFRGEAAFSTWLTRIAVHEALTRRRRRARLVALDATEELTMSDDPTPAQRASTAQLVGILEREIDALPDGLRDVLVLRDLEELDTAETAACLGLSLEAVRVRLLRARRALERALGDELALTAPSAFRVAGPRCDRMHAAVATRLGVALD
ncbi:MAG: RNA polymerase sigma factor [Deltaproteobacteria bacterium]|nr:RNA polymerase sigma factor [Deltaproteobacteria bacterium]